MLAATSRSGPMLALSVLAWAAIAYAPDALNVTVYVATLAALALVNAGAVPWNATGLLANALKGFVGVAPRLVTDSRDMARAGNRVFNFANLALPLAATLIFTLLLAFANPLLEAALRTLPFERPLELLLSFAPWAALLAFALTWAVLHMTPSAETPLEDSDTRAWHARFFRAGPVAITLSLLNALFLAANLLDLRYVWSDTPLPPGLTHAEYVHRGAYSLIATAILAGCFVILALWPKSATEASRPVRWLVYLWTAQNVFLVASSALRTLAYVEDYGMTLWRLSGLVWMALVAAGLVLIAARIVLVRTNHWLANANLIAAFAVLLASGFTDYSAIVARWNAARAAEGKNIDMEYMQALGPSAMPALRGLETPEAYAAVQTLDQTLAQSQADWRTWTVKGVYLR
jgi:Domain of unknown function (DUF4173)